MPDAHFIVSVRMRLRAAVHAPGHRCKHKSAETGAVCNEELDGRGRHGRICKTGGGAVHRHDHVRDWLAAWVAKVGGRTALTEQFVPGWDRRARGPDGRERIERAKLDVAFDNASGRRVYVDVAIVEASTPDGHERRQRAARDGAAAAAAAEDRKRTRYPGPGLTPFVIEYLGRLGESADELLYSLAPTDPAERSRVLGELGAARQSLSVMVQMGNAENVLSAS